jgi:Cdc6-like AAA superfamily ATPase
VGLYHYSADAVLTDDISHVFLPAFHALSRHSTVALNRSQSAAAAAEAAAAASAAAAAAAAAGSGGSLTILLSGQTGTGKTCALRFLYIYMDAGGC